MIRKLFSFTLLLIASTGLFAGEVWNAKAHFGGVGRHRGTGVSIGTKGYIGLGHYNGAGPNILFSDWWEFDPGTNTWTQKADYPFPTYAAASFVIGHKAYVGTGVSAGTSFYAYDPFNNSWSAIAPVPSGITDQVAFSANDKGYYLHGNSLYEYNPLTNNWITKNTAPFTPSSWSSSFTIGDKAYVKSGYLLYEYKSSTDQWTTRASFPGSATGGSAAFAVKNKGYVVCGYVGWLSELSSEVWEFDPATNNWRQLEDFPGTARRFTCGFSIGNKGYMGIGTNGTNMRDFWEFDEYLSTADIEQKFQIYPNPTSNYINFISNTPGVVMIYTISGQLISTIETNDSNQTIDLSDFPNGHYVFVFNSNDQYYQQILSITR